MSNILPKPTQAEADLEIVNSGIRSVAEAINNLNAFLQSASDAVYALPDDRLLAVLNADIGRTQTITALKTELGEKANTLLDLVDSKEFQRRAPVSLGRSDLGFVDGAFVIIPPVVEEA